MMKIELKFTKAKKEREIKDKICLFDWQFLWKKNKKLRIDFARNIWNLEIRFLQTNSYQSFVTVL